MSYRVKEQGVEGLFVISPEELGFERDYLLDSTHEGREEAFRAMGIEQSLAHSYSESYPRGVLRGLRFQPAQPQGMLLAVTQGAVYCVAVDLRPGRDYGAAFAVELSAESERMLFIPPYFAHGYLTLEADTEVVLNTELEYLEDGDSGIVYDDQILSIDWQFDRWEIDQKYLKITPKERRYPAFRNYNANTIWRTPPQKPKRRQL